MVEYTCGFLISNASDPALGALAQWSSPQTEALRVEHVGSYDHLGNAWSAAHQFARCKRLRQKKTGSFEIYRNDPKDTPPAELRTEIFLPLR